MVNSAVVTTHFDESNPVYVIKAFFYGKTMNSVRHATDQPLRLNQIPKQYQTSEYIKQGRVVNNIPAMVTRKETTGIEIIAPDKEPAPVANLIATPKDGLRASTPTANRRAARKSAAATASATVSAKANASSGSTSSKK